MPVLDRLADGLEVAGGGHRTSPPPERGGQKTKGLASASPAPAEEPPQVFATTKQRNIQKLFRETPKKVTYHLTLTQAEDEVWQFVGRRITQDLDTDELISDDRVVGMSSKDLHRPLDKPRRLKI